MEMKGRGYWGGWGKEIITGVIIAVIAAYLIGEGRFAEREKTENIPPPQAPAAQPMEKSRLLAPAQETPEKHVSKQETKTLPTVAPTRSIEEARKPPPDVSPGEITGRTETAELKKPDANNRQDHSPAVVSPPSASPLPRLKSTPPDIANIHRALRSIKKRVDEGNPHGIADPADVSAFNQYLSSLKRRTDMKK